MEKFNYYFNTKRKIDDVLEGPINKATITSVLFNLIWYAYYNVGKDEKTIVDFVQKWMEKRTNIFHLSAYAKYIRTNIKKMDKMPWRDIQDTVKVKKSELDYISSFNDIKKEKLLFCYLAVAKFMDMSRSAPTHWESESDAAIFKMARVNIPVSERDFYINELINKDQAAIHLAYRSDDLSKRIDYISDKEDDPVVIEMDENNYHELAYTYLNWKNGGGYKKCKSCGKLFKIKGTLIGKDSAATTGRPNNSQYCRCCSPKYELKYKGKSDQSLDYEPKKVICIDCGEEFYLDNYMAGRTYRCKECQENAIKQSWKDASQRYRDNNIKESS